MKSAINLRRTGIPLVVGIVMLAHAASPCAGQTQLKGAVAFSRAELVRPMNNWVDMPLYTINMPPEFESTWYFGSDKTPAIPAGFFGLGSDPWSGGISCGGIPLDPAGAAPTADMVVRHEKIEWVKNPEDRYGPREIPKNFNIRCAMVGLHEQATKPVPVTYDGGKRTENWDVDVSLAKDNPGGGMIQITWVDPDGNAGLADIEISVKVVFTFKQPQTGKVLTFKSPVEWLSETNHKWTRVVPESTRLMVTVPDSSQGNFVPASAYVGGGFMVAGACSKNDRVSHSFTLAPAKPGQSGATPGINPLVRQFPLRKEPPSSTQ
jgi:hypothetical protein